jgi:hypothetical protein
MGQEGAAIILESESSKEIRCTLKIVEMLAGSSKIVTHRFRRMIIFSNGRTTFLDGGKLIVNLKYSGTCLRSKHRD